MCNQISVNPLVSVVTIFLNAEKFIEEAIASVLSQSYDDWELLLIDDGSTDNSTEIAQQYAKQYPDKVLYLDHKRHKNLGKSTSRNLGIYNSRGKYIAFLDADDVWLPQKLEKQVAILESHPEAAMVYGNTLYWYSWTGRSEDIEHDYIPSLGVKLDSLIPPPSLFAGFFGNGVTIPCPCSVLVRRNIALEVDGFDESIQQLYEDQAFYAKIFLNRLVFAESGCWQKYRQHADSSWHLSLQTGEDRAARLTFLNWLENYLLQKGVKDTEIWSNLQRHLFSDRHPLIFSLKKLARRWGTKGKKLLKLIANGVH